MKDADLGKLFEFADLHPRNSRRLRRQEYEDGILSVRFGDSSTSTKKRATYSKQGWKGSFLWYAISLPLSNSFLFEIFHFLTKRQFEGHKRTSSQAMLNSVGKESFSPTIPRPISHALRFPNCFTEPTSIQIRMNFPKNLTVICHFQRKNWK